jgi:large subunit ribosomal protein L28
MRYGIFSQIREKYRLYYNTSWSTTEMAKCKMCGKAPSFGHNVSFSKRRTNRMWRPNLQKTTVVNEVGKLEQIRICTQCMRTLTKVR